MSAYGHNGGYVPRMPIPGHGGTAPVTADTGICRGCSIERGLVADGRVRDHLLPLELRVAGVAEPCPGGGVLPENGELRAPEPKPVVKVTVVKPTNRGTCRICGRGAPLRTDGRLSRHLDSSRFQCDGAGKLPARGAA